MISYSETQIQSALTLLNEVSTKGIENAKRIVMIEQILQHPTREETEDNGKRSKEELPDAG